MSFYNEINYVTEMLENYVPNQLFSEYKSHMFAFFGLFINNRNNSNSNTTAQFLHVDSTS